MNSLSRSNRAAALRDALGRNPFGPQGQPPAPSPAPVYPPPQEFVPVSLPAGQLHYPTPPPAFASPYQGSLPLPYSAPPAGNTVPAPYAPPPDYSSPVPPRTWDPAFPASVLTEFSVAAVQATPPPIIRSTEKDFMGHKSKLILICTMPAAQERLCGYPYTPRLAFLSSRASPATRTSASRCTCRWTTPPRWW